MISSAQKTSIDAYSYVNDMRNVAWLAGYARGIVTDGGQVNSLLVQQVNNLNLSLPVEFGPAARLASNFGDTFPIKLTCHVSGRRTPSGERIAVMKAISAETPTLLDMPGPEVWAKVIPKGAPTDAFRPVDRNDEPSAKGVNVVRLGGFVYSAAMATDEAGNAKKDCLIVLLRQHLDPEKAIPIRVYGKYAQTYFKRVKPGAPVVFVGEFRVRVRKIQEGAEGELDQVEKYPYIHANHVRVADPKEIRVVPDWAIEMMDRLRSLRDVSPDSRSQRVATGGHPRIVASSSESVSEAAIPAEPSEVKSAAHEPDFGAALD